MFMCHNLSLRSLQPVVAAIYPYYGIASSTAPINAALILSLSGRGPNASRVMDALTLTSGENESMYYAYPVSYGEATFLDIDSKMEGGWDGVFYNTTGALGPATVNVSLNGSTIPFYLYKTDWPDLGLCHWKVY